MKHAPRSRRPSAPVATGFHSGGTVAYCQSSTKFSMPGGDHQREERERAQELAEDDLQCR